MRKIKTLDITPTWAGVLPLLIRLAQNPKTVDDAHKELLNMARAADAYNEIVKKNKIKKGK